MTATAKPKPVGCLGDKLNPTTQIAVHFNIGTISTSRLPVPSPPGAEGEDFRAKRNFIGNCYNTLIDRKFICSFPKIYSPKNICRLR